MNELVSRIERELAQPEPSDVAQRRPRWPRIVLGSLILLLTPLLLTEIILRLTWSPVVRVKARDRQQTISEAVGELNRRFEYRAFSPSEELLWSLKPGANLHGQRISSLGLAGAADPPFPSVRQPGSVCVLVVGDSLPVLTYRTFPSIVQRVARTVPSAPDLTVVNASVPGYSTEQMRGWLHRLSDLRPDVVLVCAGLADRSPALNFPDRLLLAGKGARENWFGRLLGKLRLVQWLAAPSPDRWGRTASRGEEPRVAPDRFRENLEELAASIRKAGALPVFATQPTPGRERNISASSPAGDPQVLQLREAEAYNAIVKEVAAASGAVLFDLEEEFLRRNRDRLFEEDRIHLTSAGHNLIARLFVALLRDRGLLDPKSVEAMAEATRYDTSAPDVLRAEWTVVPPVLNLSTAGTTASFSVLARNAGNTRWLRDHYVEQYGEHRNFDYGGVHVQATWRTAGASSTTAPAARVRLPQDILPGESTSVTLSVAPPSKAGTYALEVALHTDGLGHLTRLGAEGTTVTVTARE